MRFIFAPRTRDLLTAAFAAASLIPAVETHAQVSWTGDLDPTDPTTWTTSANGYVGKTGTGTLDIMSGGTVETDTAFLGYETGSAGTVRPRVDLTRPAVERLDAIGFEGAAAAHVAALIPKTSFGIREVHTVNAMQGRPPRSADSP